MDKHPMAGKPVKLTGGMHKGLIFTVIDYVVNNFQGKQIGKIVKGHPALFFGLKPEDITPNLVLGTLHNVYENHVLKRVVVRDEDLMKTLLKIVSPEGEEDVTTGPVSKDFAVDDAGGPGPEGRSLPSGEVHGDNVLPLKGEDKPDRPAGGGDSGPSQEHPRPVNEEGSSPEPTPIGTGKKR
jgi:hypothetical protein